MAYDKVVDSSVLGAGLTATANAIREKTGDTALIQWMNENGFKAAVEAIEAGGGGFPNGSEWTISNVTENMSDIEYYNGTWVAAGKPGIYYSRDGINWVLCENVVASSSATYNHVAGGDGMFVAGTREGGIYYSYDGTTWNLSNIQGRSFLYMKPIRFKGKWIISIVSKGVYYSDDGITWTKSDHPGYFTYARICDGVLFASNSSTSNHYSLDGITWTQCNPSNTCFRYAGYEDGMFVGLSASPMNKGDSSGIYYSTDGITWKQSNITSGYNDHAVPFKYKNMWIAFLNGGGIYYSEDGMTWNQSNITGGSWQYSHCCYKDAVVVCCDDTAYHSTDGIIWNTYDYTTSGTKITKYAYYANGRLLLTGLGRAYYSDNGIVMNEAIYTNYTPGGAYYMKNMKYADGILVATSDDGGIYYSQVWSPS